jgi:hypothetical protein
MSSVDTLGPLILTGSNMKSARCVPFLFAVAEKALAESLHGLVAIVDGTGADFDDESLARAKCAREASALELAHDSIAPLSFPGLSLVHEHHH